MPSFRTVWDRRTGRITTWDDAQTLWDRPASELHIQLQVLVPPSEPKHVTPKWYVDDRSDEIRADIATLDSAIGDINSLLVGVGGDFANLAALLQALRADVTANQIAIAALKSDVAILKTDVATLKTDVATLKTNVSVLQTDVLTYPLTFVFGGAPVVGSMINVPLLHNITIPANLTGSRYYNATNPLVASQFSLMRITAGGSQSIIGYVNVATNGTATFSGTGSSAIAIGDRLRMTAVTIGGSLRDVGITISATRRY